MSKIIATVRGLEQIPTASKIITIQKNGVKAGVSGARAKTNKPPEKTALSGWSTSSIRRNNDFLRTVNYNALNHLQGFAFTGTVKTCPPDSDQWHKALKAFWMRLKRMDVVLIHWVIEWQRRGVPHVHCSLFFDNPPIDIQQKILSHWLAVTASWDSGSFSQHITPISNSLGWAQYTSKHAQRGLYHYQRSPENMPTQWQLKTGRMWGKWGDWPILDPIKLETTSKAWYMMRRIIRNWRIADARKTNNPKRISSARKMLTCHDNKLSSVRGLSEWLPDSVMLELTYFLQRSHAHKFTQI